MFSWDIGNSVDGNVECCAVLSHSVMSNSCNPMNCSPPGSSVHGGILQTRILEWVVMPSSRGSSQPRDWTQVSALQADPLLSEPTGKPKNTGVGSLSLLHGIFLTQELNWGLLHCRRILYQLSHKGSPRILEWVAYPFSMGTSWPRNRTGVSCIAGRFLTSWSPLMAIHAGNDQPEKYVFPMNRQNISWGFVNFKLY